MSKNTKRKYTRNLSEEQLKQGVTLEEAVNNGFVVIEARSLERLRSIKRTFLYQAHKLQRSEQTVLLQEARIKELERKLQQQSVKKR